MKIDFFLPHYDFSTQHTRIIPAAPEKCYKALKEIDLSDSWVIYFLLRMRGITGFKGPTSIGEPFVTLYDDSPNEVIWGLIAKPWLPRGAFFTFKADQFQTLSVPEYAKIVWNFSFEKVEQGTRVSTETRVYCESQDAKSKFGIYWLLIKPFSGMVRKEMLRLIDKQVSKS